MLGIVFDSAKETFKDKGCGFAIAIFLVLLALVFGLDCLVVWICMALWNACLVPVLAGTALAIGEIGFWPMFGIYLLFGFLFRSGSYIKNNKD